MKFFYGENELEISREMSQIREKYTPENVILTDVSDDNFSRIFTEIFQTDLFGSRKLFVIKNLFQNTNFAEDLVANFSRISEENELVLIEKSPDKRKKIFKDFAKIADAKEFAKLKSWQLANWLSAEVKSRKIAMNPAAQNELILRKLGAENAQAEIAQELEKFANFDEGITHKMVEKFVENNPATRTFELLNFAILGEREKLCAELEILKKSGEDPNRFLGLISSQIFALAAVIFNVSDAAKTLKINPFQLEKAREILREILAENRQDFAKKLTAELAKTDAKIKRSDREGARILVENFLMRISIFREK